MHVAAILAAGGIGSRMGSAIPKQLVDLGDSTNMLARSLSLLLGCPLIEQVVVAVPPGSSVGEIASPRIPLEVVQGGATRHQSVLNALGRVTDAADLIVIHDAARPFATRDLLERTIRAAEAHGAAIAALPVVDTVKQVEHGTIRATLPRETIFLAQTPQAFRRAVLERALAAGDVHATDEASLVERAGIPVHVVPGEAGNLKVTTPADLEQARVLARSTKTSMMRIGTGYDLHRLVEGRPLILAGVRIPFERGLQGHSDADIVCHAVTDAVLGAAALGDIGSLFPDTDVKWKDADSLLLLRGAMEKVSAAGYAVVNVDVTVIAERPKLLPYIDAMRANLASALAIDVSAVSVKGKTNEKVGEIGMGDAMACHTVAMLQGGERQA